MQVLLPGPRLPSGQQEGWCWHPRGLACQVWRPQALQLPAFVTGRQVIWSSPGSAEERPRGCYGPCGEPAKSSCSPSLGIAPLATQGQAAHLRLQSPGEPCWRRRPCQLVQAAREAALQAEQTAPHLLESRYQACSVLAWPAQQHSSHRAAITASKSTALSTVTPRLAVPNKQLASCECGSACCSGPHTKAHPQLSSVGRASGCVSSSSSCSFRL